MSDNSSDRCTAAAWSQQPGANCRIVESGHFVTLGGTCFDNGNQMEGWRNTKGRAYSVWEFSGLTTAEAQKLISAKSQSPYEFTAGSIRDVKDIYYKNMTNQFRIFWSVEAAKASTGRYCNANALIDWLD